MAGILRGDIRWADLSHAVGHEQGGRRPILIISHDIFNERSGTVIGMAVTSQPQKAGFPLTLELKDSRLPRRSWVKISQVRTFSRKRLGRRIDRVSPEEMAMIVDGLNEIIAG